MKTLALSRQWLIGLGMLLAMLGVVISNSGKHQSYTVPEVSLEEAKALIKDGAIVIDVRAAEQGLAHIPGAHMIPLEVLSASLAQFDALAKAKTVIVYCGNGSTRGPEAVHVLSQAGFTHAVNLQPGFSGWEKAGLPVDRS